MKALDLILQSDNQTITKTELMRKMNCGLSTVESRIKRLRGLGQIITVANEEDTLVIGKEYAKLNRIRAVSRRKVKKTLTVKPITRKIKPSPEPKPKALNINDLWLPVSHRLSA